MKKIKTICTFLALLMLIAVFCFPAYSENRELPHRGLDVSAWQKEIDWTKIAGGNIDFVILRCYSSGEDEYFKYNYSQALEKGIPVGAYVYMHATTKADAVKEAEAVLRVIENREFRLPLFVDIESNGIFSLGKETATNLLITELEIFENAGFNAGYYTSRNFLNSALDGDRLKDYDSWIARWTCFKGDSGRVFDFTNQDSDSSKRPTDCNIWQFSDGGDGDKYGAPGLPVDLNYCYYDYIYGSGKFVSSLEIAVKNCSCWCHGGPVKRFFHGIADFFRELFHLEKYRYCSCGIAHY